MYINPHNPHAHTGDSVCNITLHNNGLRGALSSAMLQLPHLTTLRLSKNPGLTGQLPSFAGVPQLRELSLGNCSLTGGLHPSLAQLGSLSVMWLFNNRLTGPLQPGFGPAQRHLKFLDLSGNQYVTCCVCSTSGSSSW